MQTVQRSSKIVAKKDSRNIRRERKNRDNSPYVNSIKNFILPLFTFTRVLFKKHLIETEPPGCIGTTRLSVGITGPSFLVFVKHFQVHLKSSEEHPCLLLIDNNDSHLSIDALTFCKSNEIIFLSFPSHTSHHLQPLDKSICGPFKKFYFATTDKWVLNNPDKTIYDIPKLVINAFPPLSLMP